MNRNQASKMTPAQVLELRALYASGSKQRDLAVKFDISVSQVGRIVRGELWRHLLPKETGGI